MPGGSYNDTLAAIRQRSTYNTQVSLASKNASPQLAAGTVAQARAYPWLAPQTALTLAQGGHQPGDQISHAVATASINKKGGGFWHSIGEVVTAPMRAAVSGLGSGVAELGDVGSAVGKPLTRGFLTAVETPLQIGAGVLRDVASATGTIGAGIASGVATGAAVGLAGGPLAPVSVAAGAIGGGIIGGIAGGAAQARGVQVEGGLVNPLAQSSGGQALGQLLGGGGVDLGSGFMPGGKVHENMVKAQQTAASINGHALTPGRMLASAVARPGTTPYNVLSGTADAITSWQLDPVNKLVGPEYQAQKASRKVIPGIATEAGPATTLLRRAGVLETADPAVAFDKARAFLETDGAARRFVTKATEETSPSAIRAASKGKLPVEIANQLAAADNEQDVLAILMNGVSGAELKERAAIQVGRDMASTFNTSRVGARLNTTMARLGGVLPERTVDLMDIDQAGGAGKLSNAVDQMDNWLKQARYTQAERQPILDRLMQTTTGAEARDVFDRTMQGDVVRTLKGLGHDDETISGFLRGFKTDEKLLRDQVIHEIATDTAPKAVTIGGETIPLDKANEVLEHLTYTVSLPDPRAIRQLTTPTTTPVGKSLNALYNSRAWKETTHAGDYIMGKWKISAVVRPAFVLRSLAIDHTKMVAHGLETRFSDPGSLFRMILNPDLRPSALEGAVEGDVLSRAEAYMKAQARHSVHLDADDLAPYQIIKRPGDDGFADAWNARIAELHADPLPRAIAGEGLEATKQSFWDGPLATQREELAGQLDRPELLTREGADAYLADTVGSHLSALTADNPHLLDAVATGRVHAADTFDEVGEGIPLLTDGPDGFLNPDVAPHLERMALDPEIRVPVEIPAAKAAKDIDPDYGNKIGRMADFFFTKLVDRPTDFLIRSTEFNQAYWANIADHAGMLSEDGVAALRKQLTGKVDIPEKTLGRIKQALAHPNAGRGDLVLAHLDELAKARSLDTVRSMTVDMASRRGWQDAMRILMPFTKDWQQDLTQFARLAADNPNAFRKAQMTVDGAIGSGFFHKDANGEYVFNYPGSGLISKVVTGTPGGMTARAGGLFSTSIMPGFGPVASIAASKVLPNKPEFDDFRNFMAPYGDPTAQGVVESFLPAWAKTVKDAFGDPEGDRDTANTTMQVARYLVSTGKFSTDTPEEQDRLLREAGSRAKKLLFLQALGKAVLPSSPRIEPMAEDKDGRTVTARLLSDDLKKMRDEDYEGSSEKFLAKYGDGALLFLQSATRPVVPGAASTDEQYDWARNNPEIVKALPNSYAFFAPQGGQTFDPASIARQIHTGERQALTPKQQVQLANDQVGSMIFYQIKNGLGPKVNQAQQAVLAQFKDVLMQKYPGFNTIVTGLAARPIDEPGNVSDVLIPELRKSLTIDKAKDSQTGQALDQYLQLRDAVDHIAQQRFKIQPGSFSQSAKAADLRGLLRQAALQLSQGNQGFSMLFDRVLDRELRMDTQPAQQLGA